MTTGLEAAKVIVRRNRHGEPVKIIPPEKNVLFDATYVWLRYAWAPYVAAASLWSHALSFVTHRCRRRGRSGLPWLDGSRMRVPGLQWDKRPGGGGTETGIVPDGEEHAEGRRWLS